MTDDVTVSGTAEELVPRSELERARADRAWWNEFGAPLGLTVLGWSYRHQATFAGEDPTQPGWGVIQCAVGDPLHRLLTRLRDRLSSPSFAQGAEGWRTIDSAPRERYRYIDLWLVNRKTGEGWLCQSGRWAPWDGRDAWAQRHDGKWVTGKRYFDETGDEYLDPAATDEQSIVATHWRPLPPPPSSPEP